MDFIMNFFRKIIFIFGLLLSLISINALLACKNPKKEEDIDKDY
ncbi:hypothetical protein BHWA1_01114 [Brachyspira hyodysenteriae WA1]|uniref:Uncharacterized protein n=1 Tax=Brachyspira hyodysenteriae (strain ATCC 49526 / WA1) TaxID=565034 RepID=A0A3B6VFD1_BRAHW|nr:hypothetical protein BHWA1_01114 [Brachyspira hyodysenteriae WA1]